MNARTIFLSCGLLLLLGVSACQRVETDFDPETDFTVYHTFAWEPRQQTMESEVERDFPHLMGDIRAAIATGMVARGVTEVAPNQADLLLNVYLELAPYAVDASADASGGGPDMPSRELGPLVIAPYSVTQVDDVDLNRQLQDGTLLLNVTDCANSNLVWQGWLRKVVDMDNLREVEWGKQPGAGEVRYRRRMVGHAVDRLLASFPPRQASPPRTNGGQP